MRYNEREADKLDRPGQPGAGAVRGRHFVERHRRPRLTAYRGEARPGGLEEPLNAKSGMRRPAGALALYRRTSRRMINRITAPIKASMICVMNALPTLMLILSR